MVNSDNTITCDRCLFTTATHKTYAQTFCINVHGYHDICRVCVDDLSKEPIATPSPYTHDVESFIRQDNRKRGIY
jgi:hypothetical protein